MSDQHTVGRTTPARTSDNGHDGQTPPPSERNGHIRVAAVADLHAKRTHPGAHRDLFSQIAAAGPDVVALCGDLTDMGTPEDAEVLAADLAVLRVPVVGVLGNHDHHASRCDDVKDVLRKAHVTFLDEENFVHEGVGFAGIKGFGGGFGSHMLDPFGEAAVKGFAGEAVNEALALEHALKRLSTKTTVVVLHYAPVVETVRGEPPEIFPFLGCSRLAETIDRFEVAAVVHGHAHMGAPEGRTLKGTPVHNCSMQTATRCFGKPYIMLEFARELSPAR